MCDHTPQAHIIQIHSSIEVTTEGDLLKWCCPAEPCQRNLNPLPIPHGRVNKTFIDQIDQMTSHVEAELLAPVPIVETWMEGETDVTEAARVKRLCGAETQDPVPVTRNGAEGD